MEHFAGRVAVITGAGSGFGREFAQMAAGLGMKLVLADIDAAALEQVSGALRGCATCARPRTWRNWRMRR